jgi:hypothetical protein
MQRLAGRRDVGDAVSHGAGSLPIGDRQRSSQVPDRGITTAVLSSQLAKGIQYGQHRT